MLSCNFADSFPLFSHIHRQKTCTQSSQHQETSNQQVKGEKVLDSFQSLTFSDWVLQWQAGQHFTSMVTGWLLWISVILGDNSSLWCWRIRLWEKEKDRGREKCLQAREREREREKAFGSDWEQKAALSGCVLFLWEKGISKARQESWGSRVELGV